MGINIVDASQEKGLENIAVVRLHVSVRASIFFPSKLKAYLITFAIVYCERTFSSRPEKDITKSCTSLSSSSFPLVLQKKTSLKITYSE